MSFVPPLDPARLAALRGMASGDHPDLAEKILAVFLEEGAQLLESLRQAAASGDLARMARDAHTLKGASTTVGAVEVAALAASMEERAGRREDAARDAAALGRLEAALDRVRAALGRANP